MHVHIHTVVHGSDTCTRMQVVRNKPSTYLAIQELLLWSYVWNIYGMPGVGHTSALRLHCIQLSKSMLSVLRSAVVAGMGPSAAQWVLRSSWVALSWITISRQAKS